MADASTGKEEFVPGKLQLHVCLPPGPDVEGVLSFARQLGIGLEVVVSDASTIKGNVGVWGSSCILVDKRYEDCPTIEEPIAMMQYTNSLVSSYGSYGSYSTSKHPGMDKAQDLSWCIWGAANLAPHARALHKLVTSATLDGSDPPLPLLASHGAALKAALDRVESHFCTTGPSGFYRSTFALATQGLAEAALAPWLRCAIFDLVDAHPVLASAMGVRPRLPWRRTRAWVKMHSVGAGPTAAQAELQALAPTAPDGAASA